MQKLENSSLFIFRQVISPYFGKCFTACPLMRLALNDSLNFGVKSDWNYKFYMHDKDEEIWLGGTGNFVSDAATMILSKFLNNIYVNGNIRNPALPIIPRPYHKFHYCQGQCFTTGVPRVSSGCAAKYFPL